MKIVHIHTPSGANIKILQIEMLILYESLHYIDKTLEAFFLIVLENHICLKLSIK